MASRMLSRASASVRPWEMQPGMEGHSVTIMPVSSGSRVTSSFILGFYSTLLLKFHDGLRRGSRGMNFSNYTPRRSPQRSMCRRDRWADPLTRSNFRRALGPSQAIATGGSVVL